MTKDTRDLTDLSSAVAVVGMACRFPGARTLDEFRRNLENGVESITFFSDEELVRAGVDRARLADPHYVKAAPLLEDADLFDAAFFEYSPREAAIMDPQQRLFLECAWEALEDAGHAGDASGSRTGVFAGGGGVMSTYLLSDTHFNPALTGTTASLQHVGNDKDYLSTRVSYKLNLRGPSLAVQTACSTSLVAIHLACQSLLTRECEMALAGGTTVRVPQRTGYLYKEGNVFSRDGHCRAFDADARGTVFGSGIGVVVLKRLADALADRDPIRAVIRGTAINNDGSENKSSYWAPHAAGQADAMRRALAIAAVDPATIGYVEAHGTATRKGDPTELRALTEAFGPLPAGSCAIGSVKSNIGHPESAAGVAGFIKAVLSLEHQVLFPSLHYTRPNPEVDFEHGFAVNTTWREWPEASWPRRAAVNALGIGGTNAFAILEESPRVPEEPAGPDRSCHVLTLSARTPEALDAMVGRMATHLSDAGADTCAQAFADVCYTANAGRAHFAHRLAVVASSPDEATARLTAAHEDPELHRGVLDATPQVAFLFTGQGSQRVGMARELYDGHAVFREAVDRCAESLSGELDDPLTRVLYPAEGATSPIDDTACTQPALFAIEYALATLWRHWGVQPAVLLGHSIGEIVAACVAGVMDLDAALRLTAARGRLMQALPRDGGMAAVRCDLARVEAALAGLREHVDIAAVNGPNDVVISGRLDPLLAVLDRLEQDGVTATRLKVSHAFHSPLMDPMLEPFRQVAASITFRPPSIPIVSALTGTVAGAEMATADFWVSHVRAPVRFADAVSVAATLGADVMVEIGPSPVLLGLARQVVASGVRAWLPSLRPGHSDWRQINSSLANLYVAGASIDWQAVDRPYLRRRVHLPTYPFQRKRFWIDPPRTDRGPGVVPARSALLGRRLRLPGGHEVRFESRWSAHAPAYLDDHRLFETVVVPGASHLAMTLTAMREVAGRDGCTVEDIIFPVALTLEDDAECTAQLVLRDGLDGATAFEVLSLREGADEHARDGWVLHASGRASVSEGRPPSDGDADVLSEWQRACTRPQSGTSFYDSFWEAGYHLRGAFRWIAQTWAGNDEVLCELQWPDLPEDADAYPLYPSLIDACFQCVFAGAAATRLRADAVYVPFSIRRLTVHQSPQRGARLWCHVGILAAGDAPSGGVEAEITLADEAGRTIARFEACQLREVKRTALAHASDRDLANAYYAVFWKPDVREPAPLSQPAPAPGVWVILADRASGVAEGLVSRLTARGDRCVRVEGARDFQKRGVDLYDVDVMSPDHIGRVLADVEAAGQPCRGVVHLWSLDAVAMGDAPHGESCRRPLGGALHTVQALARMEWASPPRLWLVTRGAQPVEATPTPMAVEQAPVWGLGRVMALEHPEFTCVRVDLDPVDDRENAARLFEEIWRPDDEDQIGYRRGVRYVPRLRRMEPPRRATEARTSTDGAEACEVRLAAYGQFDHLRLTPLTRRAPGPGEVEVEVHAAGLNFRDVLNALGLLQEHYARHLGVSAATEMTFGFECAGRVVAVGAEVRDVSVGDEVMAIAAHGALANFVTLPRAFVVRKPGTLSFEQAATLPLAFLTACYGLERLATLERGHRVLIHAAAGGVGQACVQWARHVGAEIFATASPGKWSALQAAGVEHVFSSRTLDFADAIEALTEGKGVDVVVNSLSGEFVDASMRVLREGGRFIELGKRDVWSSEDAAQRRPDVTFLPFDLVDVSRANPAAIAEMLRALGDHVDRGDLTPLPTTLFPVSKVAEAFRFMAEARHVGKIVITMRPSTQTAADSDTSVRSDATYLVTGGLGALGLLIAERLVAEGARHLVLVGRRPPSATAREAIARIEEAGAQVLALEADVSDPVQVDRIVATADEAFPPLRGVVHAPGMLDDGILLQQTWQRFEAVLASKVDGAWNLHTATRHSPLDFFVMFSSVASVLGNPGQANYAAANAFLDALAHHRRGLGLPGLAINWGPWEAVGMAAEGGGQRSRQLGERGFRPIDPDVGVRAFVNLLNASTPQATMALVDWPAFLRHSAAGVQFFELVAAPVAPDPVREPDVRQRLAQADDPRAVLFEYVRASVGRVLGVTDAADIAPRARLFDLGLESLMAVELRARFEESLGCPLRPTLVFDYPTVESLVTHLAGKMGIDETPMPGANAHMPGLKTRPPTTRPPMPAGGSAGIPVEDDLTGLDDDELAERLARELSGATEASEP